MISTVTLQLNEEIYTIDLSQPLDISLPLNFSNSNPVAWNLEAPEKTPVVFGDWIGSVSKGAPTNFNNIYFNPHAHGTHTECVGHITEEFYSINECLKTFFFTAEVITVRPETIGDDLVITKAQIVSSMQHSSEAIVIRTLPNTEVKLTQKYSQTNPPYLDVEAAIYLKDKGVKHLLIDLPSVDKEVDEGKLLAHNAFWNTAGHIRFDATITELIYVPDAIEDDMYVLNLQIASFHNDASPSKPVLYKLVK
ncbi:MAG: cyclase family protein [Flavobacteriaceae bacterium]